MESPQQIIEYFVENAPPSKLSSVIKCLNQLVGDTIVSGALAKACESHNLKNFIGVDVADTSSKLLLTPHNRIDSNHFFDPVHAVSVEIDHTTQQAVSSSPTAVEDAIPSARAALQEATNTYLKAHFKKACGLVIPVTAGDAFYRAYVCIASSAIQPSSFWSGQWKGEYEVAFQSETRVLLKGTTSVRVHYYEEGNVHTESNASVERDISGSSLDDVCQKVGKALAEIESEFQDGVGARTAMLSDGPLKALRRALPITKQLFDFGSSSHRLASELQKKSKS
eukprot:TRINITY_DN5980_c0_g1_i1.p1 TRINITY_DN5980_c0_g1~~TRINITY_DN5980_c0_g1_i1.p1  ORF type:complete len:281 (+),score=49.71 TRINITY_DN5980_c0_g1_i1:59-901(+)